jgi:hypothetical protein
VERVLKLLFILLLDWETRGFNNSLKREIKSAKESVRPTHRINPFALALSGRKKAAGRIHRRDHPPE